MTETRTVHDPFMGKDVQISDRLVDRLRGKYASGPHLPNGNPEFGWRQFQSPPIQHEAADRIETLERDIENLKAVFRVNCAAMADFLRSVGYVELDGEQWQDKRAMSRRSRSRTPTITKRRCSYKEGSMGEADWRELRNLEKMLLDVEEDGGSLELNRHQSSLLRDCVMLVQAMKFMMPVED